MKSFIAYISKSTLKREFALFLTIWLLSAATYLIVIGVSFENKFQVLSLFTWPILAGAFGAFSLDWVSKQTDIAGPPSNTETTVKTEMTDTSETTTTTTSEEIKPSGNIQ